MSKIHQQSVSGIESELSFDGMDYELMNDDWQSRAARLQDRRWHLMQQAAVQTSQHHKRN